MDETAFIRAVPKKRGNDIMYKDDTILVVECNTILSVTRNFVVSMLLGKSLKTDLDEMQQSIRERYFALTQKPLIACLKDAHNRYMMVTGQK